MIIFQQIFLGALFIIVSLLCLSLPVYFFLKNKFNLEDGLERFVLYSVFGMVIFTLSSYILAVLNLKFLMYLFPLLGVWTLIKFRRNILPLRLTVKHKLFFLTVLIIGIIGQVAVNAPSGFPYKQSLSDGKEDIYFYSSHGHDGVWHISLMQEMQKGVYPFQNPELDGSKLQNYHFFSDLLMSEFSRLFHFSNLDVYFRFMPIIFSLLLGLSGFIFVRAWSKSEIAGIWAMIFTYFAGSFGYFLYIATHNSLGGEAIFWLSQTHSVLGNPPHAAAFIVTTTFLFTFLKYLDSRRLLYFIFCVILGGAVIEFKVYAGILILGGLLVVGIFEAFFRKIFGTILLFTSTLGLALGIYLPNSANSQDFLIWQPWWYIRTMVVATDRLNWLDLELRRQTYIAEGNLKRVIQLEATAFLIFLFGNLGMRFIGFWTVISQIRQNLFRNSFNLFFLIITLASFLIPVFFLQKGVAWNSIQFNQYFLLFFGFYGAISVSELLKLAKARNIKILISILIFLLAVPTQMGLLWQFYSNKPLSKISYEELEGLKFLKNQREGIVLVTPFDGYERDKYKDPPIPIHTWYDTGYVSAFSSKHTLISDEEQVKIMGYKVEGLLKEREEVFKTQDPNLINAFLKKYNISYVYLAWGQKFKAESDKLNLDLIFENKDSKVFKVNENN